MSTFGTRHHGKDETGRSKQIEEYIREAAMWIQEAGNWSPGSPERVLDMGCDYGFMLKVFKDTIASVAVGVDTYYEINPFDMVIIREDMASPILPMRLKMELNTGDDPMFDLITFNHTLEHTPHPHEAMENAIKLLDRRTTIGHVFVAVPHAKSKWAQWDSHMSCWTPEFLDHFMAQHGLNKHVGKEMCFRDDLVEIWGLYV